MSSVNDPMKKQLFGHPIGLYILFFTEVWERFSYYGMRAIFSLYVGRKATETFNPGMGWDEADTFALYGWYTMLVYIMSIPGGIIADKWLGQKRSVFIGGLILVAGHGVMAIEQDWAFFMGMALIVLGVGALKPNISSMVGGLYKAGDIRRDKGFTIFYIGINIGAFTAPLLVGYVGETIGWHYGFGLAGIGMLIGQAVFMYGQKFLVGIGEPPTKSDQAEDDSFGLMFKNIFRDPRSRYSTVLLILLGIGIATGLHIGYGLLVIFLAFIFGLMMVIYRGLSSIGKDRFAVLLLSFLLIIVFWGAYEQAGGLMNIYTANKVDRFVGGWQVPASWFQSLSAGFIILIGALVGNFWSWRKSKGKESSSLFKMAIGTMIMGLGFVFMARASLQVLSAGQASLIWVVSAYLFHVLGELCVSPVALSFITKLAPAKYVSIIMGVYFAATGLGNKVAGAIGEASQTEPINIAVIAENEVFARATDLGTFNKAENIELQAWAYLKEEVLYIETEGRSLLELIDFESTDARARFVDVLATHEANPANPYRVDLSLANARDYERIQELSDDPTSEPLEVSASNYSGTLSVFEAVNRRELFTFISITGFTIAFGILLLLFLKRLKRLTHGIEDAERSLEDEQLETSTH